MLVDSKFFLTDPAQFNDPFEFKNQLIIGSDEELRSFFGPVVDDTYPEQRLTPGEREAHIVEMVRAVKLIPTESSERSSKPTSTVSIALPHMVSIH